LFFDNLQTKDDCIAIVQRSSSGARQKSLRAPW
jgi:hypothetical protein